MVWWICGALVGVALLVLLVAIAAMAGSLRRFSAAARTVRLRVADLATLTESLAVTERRLELLARSAVARPQRPSRTGQR